ncbi:MAG: S41 family peptidase [Chlamydiota bacterium]
MKKLIIAVICLFSGSIEAKDVALKELRPVMGMFFDLHVEVKTFTPTIVKRFVKLYIDQFDGEKMYLLRDEIEPYLNLSEEKASLILQKIDDNDFSDFFELRQLFCKAIQRSRALRPTSVPNLEKNSSSSSQWSDFATNEKELSQRQYDKFQKFFSYQQKRFGTKLPVEKQNRLFSLIEKKLRFFENIYLSEKESAITTQILKAFAKSLDAHSSFFSDEEAFEMRISLEKQFEGYGVVLSENVDGVFIAGLVKGSPAEECGQIHLQDRLVEIDQASVRDFTFEEVLEAMKKNKRKDITLGFLRENNLVVQVHIEKRPISMQEDRLSYTVEPFENGVIGKLHLNSFYENDKGMNSDKDIREALTAIQKIGPIKGIVLDLRENSGGFLSQAVKVAGIFMSSGVVAVSKYSKGELRYLRNVYPKSTYAGPLVILTSKLSASAAEIVAQALQDYGIAIVVGDERTFGKGSIQYQTVTREDAEIFFKVTVGKYYTVSGRTTQIEGVKADIVVPSEFSYSRCGERYLEYPLPSDHIPDSYQDSLGDLDPPSRTWFEYLYLPHLQNHNSFWTYLLPKLKESSTIRLAHNKKFQVFLEEQKKKDPNEHIMLEKKELNKEDLQLAESLNILKDMIHFESQIKKGSSEKVVLQQKK